MKFDLKGTFTFSGDISSIKNEIEKFISTTSETLLKRDADKKASIESYKIGKNSLFLNIVSG